jgi:hypothetical protein
VTDAPNAMRTARSALGKNARPENFLTFSIVSLRGTGIVLRAGRWAKLCQTIANAASLGCTVRSRLALCNARNPPLEPRMPSSVRRAALRPDGTPSVGPTSGVLTDDFFDMNIVRLGGVVAASMEWHIRHTGRTPCSPR